jgi:hypothetical protein
LVSDTVRPLITRNSRGFAPVCRMWAGTWCLTPFATHRQFAEIAAGIERRLSEHPDPASWRGLVVAIQLGV